MKGKRVIDDSAIDAVRKDRRYLLLERGRCFTLTALAEHLNEVHGGKSSGVQFSAIDVQKYMSRGHLPEYIGGNILTEVRDDLMGVKMIKIEKEVHKSFIKQK